MKTIVAIILNFYFIVPIAQAQLMEAINNAEDASYIDRQQLETISVIGTRRPIRAVTDTPVPIDIIAGDDFIRQGTADLSNSLRTLVPSYNVNAQPINDAATFVRPANLRGMAPDQSLVLLNGRRRHRSAVITFTNNGLNEGSQSADISVIPAIALKQVEVLRDSASAQYGSDAIAGAINFVLKDRPQGGVVQTQWGQTYVGDGDSYRVSANIGLPLANRGFISLSGEWHEADATVRSVQRKDAQALIARGNTKVEQPYANIWGQPDVSDDYKIFINSGFDIFNSTKVYAFGNYAEREVEGGFFFRNPNTKGGVFTKNNGKNRLVLRRFDLDEKYSCANVSIADADKSEHYLGTDDKENCQTFNERFPGGFRPKFTGNLTDEAAVIGLKGSLNRKLNYDVSYGYGQNNIDFSIRDTVNPSLGVWKTPTKFYLGAYTQTEHSVNVDLNYPWAITIFDAPLYIATGLEWRNEEFEITAGEPDSYKKGKYAEQGASVGANGFQGFSPDQAGAWDRSSYALYLDLEADPMENLTTKLMGRIEKFEGFDANYDYKFATLYQAHPQLGFRSSVGTGFRVPTVGQENLINTATGITNYSKLNTIATFSVNSAAAKALGARPLEAEQSFTFGGGIVAEVGALSLTVDYFNISVDDRIGMSKRYDCTVKTCPSLGKGSKVRFFGNGFDSRTQGVDVVASMDVDTDLIGGNSELIFAGSWTKTKVTSRNEDFLDDKGVLEIEDGLPHYRANITFKHAQANWGGFARINYFGSYTETHAGEEVLLIHAGYELTLDVEVDYTFMEQFNLAVGADNIFNNFPDRNPYDTKYGSKYPESSPMGITGGFYYVRASMEF